MKTEVKNFALQTKHPVSLPSAVTGGAPQISFGQSRYEECFNHVLGGLMNQHIIPQAGKITPGPELIISEAIKITDAAMQALYDKHQVDKPTDTTNGGGIIKKLV